MTQIKESPFRILHFPDHVKADEVLNRSILQLGPILNSHISLHVYVEEKLKEVFLRMQDVPHHVPLDHLVTSFVPNFRRGQNERNYNMWISKQIEYHLIPETGRVVLLIIPQARGKVQDTLRGYAKHTGFELGLCAMSHRSNDSNVVVCIEKGAPEEAYYRDTLEGICPNMEVYTSIDESIEVAYNLATIDAFKKKRRATSPLGHSSEGIYQSG